MTKSTPSTALIHVPARPSRPWRAGKCFFSPRTSRTGAATRPSGPYGIAQEPAPGHAPARAGEVSRLLDGAAIHGLRAAGLERTARRQARQVRRLTRDRVERLLAPQP